MGKKKDKKKDEKKSKQGKKNKKSKQSAEGGSVRTHRGTDINVIEGAEIGPGGGEIILENDQVRISDIALEPGQCSALHTHLLDYMLVQVEGDEICTKPHPDTQGEYNRRMILETRPGDTCFIEKGGSEVAVNTGKKRWREICIELK